MRVCVMSDTHGGLLPLKTLKPRLGSPDALFHLGDHCRDGRQAALYLGCPLYQVKGNCDRGEDEPEELCFTLEGKRFLLMHGHRHPLDELTLYYLALEKRADAVLFGHTHVSCASVREGILILNPGSLSSPRYGSAPGCAVLSWEKDAPLRYEFIRANGGIF